ncbi:hypothetical protein GGR57DRAFT_84460 [Xylariaceae sp. FL1272]|nr:hypothetical protein GGR57DRAFT_84460 [Xylariaceae sp. FL1272]
MTDTASNTSDNYASSSTGLSSALTSSPAGRRVSTIRPPPLDLTETSNSKTSSPRARPVMAMNGQNRGPHAVAAAQPVLPPTPVTSSSHPPEVDIYGNPIQNRKRAKSIDVNEANNGRKTKLSLYTPATERVDEPRELICLCVKAPKVPRPRNGM